MSARMKLLTPGHIALLALIGLILLVAPVFGQDGPAKPDDVGFVIAGLTAILIPVASTYSLSGLKKALAFVDDLSPVLQQILGFLIGFGISKLAGLLGTALPADLHAWDGTVVQSVLAGLATLGVHAIRKSK